MAAVLDPKASFTDTAALVKNVADELIMTDPTATPFLKYISPNLNNLSGAFDSDPYYWVDDTLEPVSIVLVSRNTKEETTLYVASNTGEWFRKGTVIQIDDELLLVKVNSTSSKEGDTIEVSHSFGGTVYATHTTGSVAYIAGHATLETETTWDSAYATPTLPYNRFQIMSAPVEMTQIEMNTKQYSGVNKWDYQRDKQLTHTMRRFNKTLFVGQRLVYSTPSSASVPSSMGGLLSTDANWPIYDSGANVIDLNDAALTEDHIEDAMKEIFTAVGTDHMPNLLVCAGHAKRKISSWWENRVRIDRSESTVGLTIDRIQTDFGELDVLLDAACPPASIFLLNSKLLKIGPYTGCAFSYYAPAVTMIGKQEVLWGAYTFEIGGAKCHGRIYDFSLTA